jgi:hypothetical protein
VIARHVEVLGQPGEHAFLRGLDRADLAVHHLLGADHLAAERLADGLVAQAHAQQRHLAGEVLEHGHRDAGLGGLHGPGETQMWSGLSASISSIVISSLRKVRTSAPSSPKYCTRL